MAGYRYKVARLLRRISDILAHFTVVYGSKMSGVLAALRVFLKLEEQ
jgi:hypothetical protein